MNLATYWDKPAPPPSNSSGENQLSRGWRTGEMTDTDWHLYPLSTLYWVVRRHTYFTDIRFVSSEMLLSVNRDFAYVNIIAAILAIRFRDL